MLTSFKAGDTVIGNSKAESFYNITREGWVGTVLSVTGDILHVKGRDNTVHWVRQDCFDHYIEDLPSPDQLSGFLPT